MKNLNLSSGDKDEWMVHFQMSNKHHTFFLRRPFIALEINSVKSFPILSNVSRPTSRTRKETKEVLADNIKFLLQYCWDAAPAGYQSVMATFSYWETVATPEFLWGAKCVSEGAKIQNFAKIADFCHFFL